MNNLKLVKNIDMANAITHNGKFHIDEVFSTVLLVNLYNNINLIRLDDINNLDCTNKIIYDIGMGEFDHHQPNAKMRKNGIRYSSFGLLWEKYGKEYLRKINCKDIDYAWKSLDIELVETIDKIDNAQIEKEYLSNYTILNIIENFNPSWNCNIDTDIRFKEAVKFADIIFQNEINSILAKIEAKEYLKQNYKKFSNNYIILEKYIPYNDFIIEKDKQERIEFVIYPSKRNGYEVRTVLNRKIFPKEWHNLTEKEFYTKYNINGMLYCHTNGKLCITDSIDTAIMILKLT